VVAVLFVALILGHIYIGTLGMEGAFEAMGTGEVDLNWAKEHHDRLACPTARERRPAGAPIGDASGIETASWPVCHPVRGANELRSTALANIPVGVVVERRRGEKARGSEFLWRPVSVFAGNPSAAPWTPLSCGS